MASAKEATSPSATPKLGPTTPSPVLAPVTSAPHPVPLARRVANLLSPDRSPAQIIPTASPQVESRSAQLTPRISAAVLLAAMPMLSLSGSPTVAIPAPVSGWTCAQQSRAHDRAVNSLAVSTRTLQSTTMLATGSGDGTVKLWLVVSARTDKFGAADIAIAAVDTLRGHDAGVLTVEFSRSGTLLASGSIDGTYRLWRVATRECEKLYEVHAGHWVRALAFHPDGQWVFSGGDDGDVAIRDVSRLECEKSDRSSEHQGDLCAIAVAHHEHLLVSGCTLGNVKVWQVATGVCLTTLCGHQAPIKILSFSGDDQFLATSCESGWLIVWSVAHRAGHLWEAVRATQLHSDPERGWSVAPHQLWFSATVDAALPPAWLVAQRAEALPGVFSNVGPQDRNKQGNSVSHRPALSIFTSIPMSPSARRDKTVGSFHGLAS
eukprot:TRINITY_DN9400_c0_g1_i1.p1 TRINITY_DN9400_c0_g1~~TRINITY_DN9400_c0_g1_i1.p1  ORF type:complete len:509 (-),score=44.47 TRINITY_DN9400_c0_g1_i1:256-1557(-)